MIGRRALLAAGLLSGIPSRLGFSTMLPTIVMTFDTYADTYTNALFDMDAKGIPGTFFADADHIGNAGQPSRDNLIIMAMKGWEIGARVYGTISGAEANMVAVMNNDRGIALSRLKAARDLMYAQGFAIKSIAAAQRAWCPQLRGMAAQLFDNVRVADITNYGTVPVSDRLYIRDGGSASWSISDTIVSLTSWLDGLIAAGPNAIGIPIIHSVNTVGDPLYTISPAIFQGFTAVLQSRIAAGLIRATTLAKAIS